MAQLFLRRSLTTLGRRSVDSIVRLTSLLFLFASTLLLVGCDADISGDANENQAPNTSLSVRDTSLVDNLGNAGRLASTVNVSWSGIDPDGFVAAYEIRFFAAEDQGLFGPDEGWTTTTRQDSLILLPIKLSESTANVRFEVRAIDNEGLKDPTPAETVFPIRNSPPEIRFNTFDLPPEETFTVFSFSWDARDPEGESNLARIEISLNDSLNYTALPADTRFATFVAETDPNASDPVVDARVFTGRGFQSTQIFLPGLRLNASNTFYLRAVDQTDTTSVALSHEWFVRKPSSEVLFVNDYRKSFAPILQNAHLQLLRAYLPEDIDVDVWNISEPFLSGSTGVTQRSSSIPPTVAPTLQQTLTLFKYIYWVSTNTTSTTQGTNLPFVAQAMDQFFENGGKLMVHSPIGLPTNPDDNVGNSAILLLPLSDLITFPDSLRSTMRLPAAAPLTPSNTLNLPVLSAKRLLIGTLPYQAVGNNIPLYETTYRYQTRQGGRQGDWFGPATVASISEDRRVGLFALPIFDERNGSQLFEGVDGDPDAPFQAIFTILDELGFPRR